MEESGVVLSERIRDIEWCREKVGGEREIEIM